MPEDLVDDLDEYAQELGIKRSPAIRMIVKNHLDARNADGTAIL